MDNLAPILLTAALYLPFCGGILLARERASRGKQRDAPR